MPIFRHELLWHIITESNTRGHVLHVCLYVCYHWELLSAKCLSIRFNLSKFIGWK